MNVYILYNHILLAYKYALAWFVFQKGEYFQTVESTLLTIRVR